MRVALDDNERKRDKAAAAARDQHLKDIEQSLDTVLGVVEDSRREVQQSRDLLQDRRDQDQRDDQVEDARDP